MKKVYKHVKMAKARLRDPASWLPLAAGASSRNLVIFLLITVQPADIGWPTGNGKKLNSTQAQLGQAACLAVA